MNQGEGRAERLHPIQVLVFEPLPKPDVDIHCCFAFVFDIANRKVVRPANVRTL